MRKLIMLVLFVAATASAQQPSELRMQGNVVVTFTTPWTQVGPSRPWVNELRIASPTDGAIAAEIFVTVEDQLNPQRAARRIVDVAGPEGTGGEIFAFEGWPAFRGTYDAQLRPRVAPAPSTAVRTITLAIAEGKYFILAQGRVFDVSNPEIAAHVERVIRSLRIPANPTTGDGGSGLSKLRDQRRMRDTSPALPTVRSAGSAPVRDRGLGNAVLAVTGAGEVEIAVSKTGKSVLVATNAGYANSQDSGVTYSQNPRSPGGFPFNFATRGDPTTTRATLGNFFLSYLGDPRGVGTAANGSAVDACTVAIARSSNAAAPWVFRGHAVQCARNLSANSNCFPDQQHIAADEFNSSRAIGRSPSGARFVTRDEQLYAVWRNFSATIGDPNAPTTCDAISTGSPTARASCSVDGGTTWSSSPIPVGVGKDFDQTRLTVGRDGSVYIVTALDSPSPNRVDYYIDKLSSCESGFNREPGFPHRLATADRLECPPGLDRCENVGMPSVTVSKQFADLVWVGGLFPVSPFDDEMRVAMSSDGGLSFHGWRVISDATAAHRYFPWLCASGDHLFATWYDRRAAVGSVPSDVSLTDFYLGVVDLEPGGPKTKRNINLSRAPDSQCMSGWPGGAKPDAMTASTKCPSAAPAATSGKGVPKYGDYNGLSCAADTAYAAWASNVIPNNPGVPAVGLSVWARTYEASRPAPAPVLRSKPAKGWWVLP
ncbi:MAG: hypothetical protein ABI885_25915 [Gammaproteobacteria bacterium]